MLRFLFDSNLQTEPMADWCMEFAIRKKIIQPQSVNGHFCKQNLHVQSIDELSDETQPAKCLLQRMSLMW